MTLGMLVTPFGYPSGHIPGISPLEQEEIEVRSKKNNVDDYLHYESAGLVSGQPNTPLIEQTPLENYGRRLSRTLGTQHGASCVNTQGYFTEITTVSTHASC